MPSMRGRPRATLSTEGRIEMVLVSAESLRKVCVAPKTEKAGRHLRRAPAISFGPVIGRRSGDLGRPRATLGQGGGEPVDSCSGFSRQSVCTVNRSRCASVGGSVAFLANGPQRAAAAFRSGIRDLLVPEARSDGGRLLSPDRPPVRQQVVVPAACRAG